MYSVLAFYEIVHIDNPQAVVKAWKRFLQSCDATARIYLSEDGINAQMSISDADYPRFEKWLRSDKRFAKTDVKVHTSKEHAFPKLTVKYREQLVALDKEVDRKLNGTYLTPKEWTQAIKERDDDTLILDIRNDYEWDVGHFEGAERPNFKTFREFPKYAEELKKRVDPKKTKVMMSCTGGIRCEYFSPLMKEMGFENVYQLKGGVIRYGLEEGQGVWEGNLFVFDDRMVVPIDDAGEGEVISSCTFCNEPTDHYYNCANMDCNKLYLSCASCAGERDGCCSTVCHTTGRVRPFTNDVQNKPYRKLPYEIKQELSSKKEVELAVR